MKKEKFCEDNVSGVRFVKPENRKGLRVVKKKKEVIIYPVEVTLVGSIVGFFKKLWRF
ncbi:MAG: hypothetical protein J7L21_01905 [Sulfurimonas sp.]|nr:hypothetical protein [Sulfurimonas sp.]